MSAPTPVAEKFTPCAGSTFTIGSGSDLLVLTIMDGGYTKSYDVDPMTNSGSGGAYEDVKTINKVTGQFKGAWVNGTPPIMEAGDIFPVVIDNADGPYLACNARFNDLDIPILSVDKGLVYNFKITSQGAIVTVRPS